MSIRIYLALAGAVATLGSCTLAQRIDADRDRWRSAARDYKRTAETWEALYRKSEALRGQEARQAAKAVSAEQLACADRIASARASMRAIRAITSKPVKLDAKGCPVRLLVKADELAPALGVR